MNKWMKDIHLAAAGAVLILLGMLVPATDSLKTVSGICISFGGAGLALGTGGLVQSLLFYVTKDKETKRAERIEASDERNVRIREKTGYMVAKVMNYLLCAAVLALGFLHADIWAFAMVAFLLLAELILAVFFLIHYSEKM